MAVPAKQSIPINFSGGLDLKTDPKQVQAGKFLSMTNSVFTTGGQLTKRNGFSSLGTTIVNRVPILDSILGSNVTSGRAIYSYNNELVLLDGFNLYSYEKDSSSWNYKGRATLVKQSTSSVSADGFNKENFDSAYDSINNVTLFAWYENETPNGVFYSFQDNTTGQILVNRSQVTSSNFTTMLPHCISLNGTSYVFYYDSSDTKLHAAIVTPSSSASVVVASDINTTNVVYDVAVINGIIYLTYYTSGAAIKTVQLNSGLGVIVSFSEAEAATNGISVFADQSFNIWVAYNNGTATKAFILNPGLTSQILAPTIVDSSALSVSCLNVTGVYSTQFNKAYIFYDQSYYLINYNTLTIGGTVGTAGTFMSQVNLASKAFSVNGIPHVIGVFTSNSNTQPTYFLLNLYNTPPLIRYVSQSIAVANIAASINPSSAGITPSISCLSNVYLISTGIYQCSLGVKGFIGENVANGSSSVLFYSPVGSQKIVLDFTISNPNGVVLGDNLLIGSGEIILYDGKNVVEYDFHIYPESVSASVSGSGSFLSTGKYGYLLTYEWLDNEGQNHVSTVSAGVGTTNLSVTAGQNVTLTIPYLGVTNKYGVVVGIYRTQANGSTYFKLTSFTQPFNLPLGNTFTYVDTVSDTSIQSNLQIYTTGEVPNTVPLASTIITTYKNRVMLVPSQETSEFLYSKQVLSGSPVAFGFTFIQNVGTAGGSLTGVYQMDDKLILFKGGSLLYMVGTGPTASGSGNDFTDPLPVAFDAGCVDSGSIVLTPMGLMFKSDKGIYLLDRGLSASYIGADIEAYNNNHVLSAQLIPNSTQVRFLLDNGITLMYDYYYKQWGTFSIGGVSDCIWEGQHTILASNGNAYQEAPGTYLDGSSPVLMSFTTSWIKLAGLQGYQRFYFFYLLAQYISAHQLTVSVAFDYVAGAVQSNTITPDASSTLEQWRVFMSKQRCQAFQITLQEVYGGTPGAGFTLSGLNLIAGAKAPFTTISSAQSVG